MRVLIDCCIGIVLLRQYSSDVDTNDLTDSSQVEYIQGKKAQSRHGMRFKSALLEMRIDKKAHYVKTKPR